MNLQQSIEPNGVISPVVNELRPLVVNKCKCCNSHNTFITLSTTLFDYIACKDCGLVNNRIKRK